MEFHPTIFLVPGLYLSLLLYLGWKQRRGRESAETFILGGRALTLPAFVATLVTTWYGGILGVGEFTYLYGLSNWFVFGLPYYVFAALYAWFVAPRIRNQTCLTIPDQIGSVYGDRAKRLSSIWTFFMTLPAPYMVMIGFLVSWMTDWPLGLSILLGTVFSMGYVSLGGFGAVVRTDKLQFVLMFLGFAVLLGMLFVNVGGPSALAEKLPDSHLDPTGGNSYSFILAWWLIAIWTLVDPGFHQRCAASSSPETARKGILVAIGFWFLFDLMTTLVGLYARALLPDLQTPALSFPALAVEVLPPFLVGLFLTGLLATIMSTIDSFFLLSATSFGHDLLGKDLLQKVSPAARIRIGLLVTACLAFFMALAIPSVVNLWYVIGTLLIPPVLWPFLMSLSGKPMVRVRWVLTNLVLGFIVPLGWLIAGVFRTGSLDNPTYPLGLQPMFPGLTVSAIVLFIAWIDRPEPEFSEL